MLGLLCAKTGDKSLVPASVWGDALGLNLTPSFTLLMKRKSKARIRVLGTLRRSLSGVSQLLARDRSSWRSNLILPVLAAAALVPGAAERIHAQTTWDWRSESVNGSWTDGNNWWNGSGTGVPAGAEMLRFNNNVQLTLTNNLSAANRWRILFQGGASSDRTINGSTANTFFDFGGNIPYIQNDSAATHTLNFRVINGNSANSGYMDINANSGMLVFAGGISASGGTRTIAQNGGGTAIYSGNITNESGATLNFEKNGAGSAVFSASNSYAGTTTVNAGALTISHASALGATSAGTTVASGATLQMSNGITVSGEALTLAGTGISSGGALRAVNGANSYLGTITLSGGNT
jgi:autotransporter-associated beta strand protein